VSERPGDKGSAPESGSLLDAVDEAAFWSTRVIANLDFVGGTPPSSFIQVNSTLVVVDHPELQRANTQCSGNVLNMREELAADPSAPVVRIHAEVGNFEHELANDQDCETDGSPASPSNMK